MFKKNLVLGAMFLLMITKGFSQDASRKDSVISITETNKDSVKLERNLTKPHAIIDDNKITSTPGTTSGTLGSTVNPNTEFVIPFGGRKKAAAKAAKASGDSGK